MSDDSHMSRVRHAFLTDVASQVSIILRELNVDPEASEYAGNAVANHMAEHWAGENMTIPKDYLFKVVQRDLKIFEEVRGNNMSEVARRYGITKNAVYRVIKRIRRRAVAEKQPDLF